MTKHFSILMLFSFVITLSNPTFCQNSNTESVIKIGILHSSTGFMKISEQSLIDAALMAVEEINKKGGIKGKLILPIVEDGGSDWKTFADKAEKLIVEDKVVSIFGCWTSASRKEVAKIVEKNNSLLWYPVQYEGFETSPNIIYTGSVPNQQILPALDWCFTNIGKTVFLVGSDYIFPIQANRVIKAYLKKKNGTLLGEEYMPLNQTNYKNIIQQISILKPDLIINTINGESNIGFFLELTNTKFDQGYTPSVISFSIAEDEIRSIGTKLSENKYASWSYFQSIDTYKNNNFITSFKKRYGSSRVTDDAIINSYNQIYLFAKAASLSNPITPSTIKAKVLGMHFSSVGGDIIIDSTNHHSWKKSYLGKVDNYGQFKIIWSSDTLIRPDPYLKYLFTETTNQNTSAVSSFLEELQAKKDIINLSHSLKSQNSFEKQYASFLIKKSGKLSLPIKQEISNSLKDEDNLVVQNSLDALDSLGIEALSEINAIIFCLNNPSIGVNFRASKLIASLSSNNSFVYNSSILPKLNEALLLMTKYKLDAESINILTNSIKILESKRRILFISKIKYLLSSNLWVILPLIYILIYLFLRYVGTRLFPLWVLARIIDIKPDEKIEIFGIKIQLQYILIVGLLKSNSKLIDAWLCKYLTIARNNFLEINTVSFRKDYIPTGISINGNKQDQFNIQILKEYTNKNRWSLLIEGEGGSGKTSLACYLGLKALDEKAPNRLCTRTQMLPILIEPGSNFDLINKLEQLKSIVLQKLSGLIEYDQDIPDFLFKQLLRQNKILLIIDDLTNLTNIPWTLPQEKNFPFPALIVTFKNPTVISAINPTYINPLLISGEKLSYFIDAYLINKKSRDLFTNEEFFEACKKLISLVELNKSESNKGVTILLTKLYVDQLISSKLNPDTLSLPRNIPTLIIGYINELNRVNLYSEMTHYELHRHIQNIAWELIKDDFFPRSIKRDKILAILNNDVSIFNYIEKRLGLIQTIGIDYSEVKFTIDIIAEYLACFYMINHFGTDESSWDSILNKIEAAVAQDQIISFITALRETCLIKGKAENIPNFVHLRLDIMLGLAQENKGIIKVGILHSLTGNMAISERSLVSAATMAINEINNKGGVLGKKIKYYTEDGASDRSTFEVKARKLIYEDQVSSIFGCWTSADRKRILPIVEEGKNLLWYPIQYEGFESSPNIIYTGVVPNQQIIPALDWCIESFGTRIFLLGSDYEFPKSANDTIKLYLKKQGFPDPVGERYFTLGEKYFDDLILELKNVQPNFVFNTLNGESNKGFFTTLKRAGIHSDDMPVMSVSIAEDEVLNIGPTKIEGHYCAWSYFQSLQSDNNTVFIENFKEAFGEISVTDDPIETAYFQIYLFAKAVELSNSTEPLAIREAAKGLKFIAPGGEVQIDPENLHTWKVSRIGKIKSDGQFKIVWDSNQSIRPDPFLKNVL